MNGIHDLGGMHGFGPVVREEDEPTFHAEWEARVWGMVQAIRGAGYYNIDQSRYGIEQMAPADYLRASYYERWLASLERNLIEGRVIAGDEIDDWFAKLRRDPTAQPHPDPNVIPPAPPAEPPSEPAPAPRFAVGDAVVTRNINPHGHTRLPRYARGKHGVVLAYRGVHTLPDTHALGLGANPHPLYNVRFEARELWGDAAEPHETVSLDLWDCYLEPQAASR